MDLVGLGDHGDLPRDLLLGQIGKIRAIEHDASSGRCEVLVQVPEEGRLPASVGPQDAYDLPLNDGEIDTVQHQIPPIGVMQVPHLECQLQPTSFLLRTSR